METLTQIFSVNLEHVPVMSTDRFISRKDQAKLARELFKRIGVKGVSVTAPRYSMAQSVDVRLPSLDMTNRDFEIDGKIYYTSSILDMPDNLPAKIKRQEHYRAREAIHKILAVAFPAHDDRSDTQSDYFDYKWSVD